MVAVMLFFRVLVNKHAPTGASPAVSVQLLNLRVGLRFLAKTGKSNHEKRNGKGARPLFAWTNAVSPAFDLFRRLCHWNSFDLQRRA